MTKFIEAIIKKIPEYHKEPVSDSSILNLALFKETLIEQALSNIGTNENMVKIAN